MCVLLTLQLCPFSMTYYLKTDRSLLNVMLKPLTALVSPHMKLLGQLRYDQERSPALALLGLENVSKNVVSNVDDVLSFSTQQVANDV